MGNKCLFSRLNAVLERKYSNECIFKHGKNAISLLGICKYLSLQLKIKRFHSFTVKELVISVRKWK